MLKTNLSYPKTNHSDQSTKPLPSCQKQKFITPCVMSAGGFLSRQASLPNQRHHTLTRAPAPCSPHPAPHTDDSYTLYSPTHPDSPRPNGLNQHPGTVCSSAHTLISTHQKHTLSGFQSHRKCFFQSKLKFQLYKGVLLVTVSKCKTLWMQSSTQNI